MKFDLNKHFFSKYQKTSQIKALARGKTGNKANVIGKGFLDWKPGFLSDEDQALELPVVGLGEIEDIDPTGAKIPIHVFTVPTERVILRCDR